MPITRFSVVLPSLQVPLALGLWEWGIYQLRGQGYGAWPAAGLVCYGINAPAILPSKLIVYPFRMQYPPHFLSHYSLSEWAFFGSVLALWFLVGLMIDRRRNSLKTKSHRATILGVLWYLGLVLEGIFLFLQALQGFASPGHEGSYWLWGSVIKNLLFVAWSVVLIGVPIFSLLRSPQMRTASSG